MGKKKSGGDRKGKKASRKREHTSKYKQYEIKDGKADRKKTPCPKCGAGVFMADHKDRWSCGKCGYTKWKK